MTTDAESERMRAALETIAFEAGMSADPDGGPWYKDRLLWCEATARNALPEGSWLAVKRPLDPWRGYKNATPEQKALMARQTADRRGSVRDIVDPR